MSDYTSFFWNTSDGIKIYGAHWPVKAPRAVLAVVHGLGEHIHRYDRFAHYFQQDQIAVVGYDRRGHGQSTGKRGHTHNLEVLLEEIEVLLEKADTIYPDIPVFLFGHSMGGNLVLTYLLQRRAKVRGCIASAPWIQLRQQPSPFLLALGRLMFRIYPAFGQPSGLDPRQISTVPAEVEAYRNDPLVHDRITSGTGITMLKAADELAHYRGDFPVPLLVYHGKADPIVDVAGSRELTASLEGNIRYQEWPGLYHETHHEANWEEVLGVVEEWINTTLTKP